jgi:hypothetical protein
MLDDVGVRVRTAATSYQRVDPWGRSSSRPTTVTTLGADRSRLAARVVIVVRARVAEPPPGDPVAMPGAVVPLVRADVA